MVLEPKVLTNQVSKRLPKLYETLALFSDVFPKMAVNEVPEGTKAFVLKTNDFQSVIREYDTTIAIGEGSRFGAPTEVKAVDTTVPFDAPYAFNDAIDSLTANDDSGSLIAPVLASQMEAIVEKQNSQQATKLIAAAGTDIAITAVDADGVLKMFNGANKADTQNKVKKTLRKLAYVNSDVYAAVQDHPLTTSAKKSSVNIDEGTVLKFKGREVIEIADEYFGEGVVAIFTVEKAGMSFAGVEGIQTPTSTTHLGVYVQHAGQVGNYVPDSSKKAISKATLTTP